MQSSSEFESLRRKLLQKAKASATEAPLSESYGLFQLTYPTTDTKATQSRVLFLWLLNKNRPAIRDFEKNWQESTDRPHTEYQFQYWNRELAHLQRIAENEGLEALEDEELLPANHPVILPELTRMGF
ncbi:hypothetical protein N7466_001635 [Penicillium verhagenii]|uniref:uncharacterized protein n=1 Tax=Penicillium verhagenii TaxID=1562060 RepID=UPI002545028C|nr:uncharacterized protein N7466_001635 [Penicillium verhagenii]KAJ5938501.1 hypothetical protein N7466_001635 [Penicillium verhagenii]